MQAQVQVSPEWFTAAWRNLVLIEEHASDYEDPEEGDKAPSKEVFEAVRTFLTALRNEGEAKLEAPRMFVSPNGQLVLTYGNKNKSIDIRFAPELFFFFKHCELAPVKGNRTADAVQLVSKHFRI